MCGVFGIYAPDRDVARVTYFGLFALQHRGQESAGIAVSDRGRLTVLRDMGLVTQVFDERNLSGLHGELAIGHTRYSTTGSNAWANAQPLVHHGRTRTVALAECALASGLGAELELPAGPERRFGEGGGQAIVACTESFAAKLRGVPVQRLGTVGGDAVCGLPLDELRSAWDGV